MAKIKDVPDFRKSDEIVEYVIFQGSELFRSPLDQKTTDYLVRVGGKLSGAYAYIGQKSAHARARRDVYAQKLSEVEKELTLQYLKDQKGYKVTMVRAMVVAEVQELQEFVIQAETEKNQWENVLEACERMIGFVQSAIKVKEGERFASKRSQ